MVIFRDPDPHRHASEAIRAALGIQRRAREINAELEGQFEPISMHVGVNSGVAFVGATKIEGVAGARWTYTASGPTTNLAARVAALAEAGAVVVSDETQRRLGDQFEVEDMGFKSLKNVAEPCRVYRLIADRFEPASAQRSVDPAERRREPRHPVAWPVRAWIGEDAVDGHAVEANAHGFYLVTAAANDRFTVGTSYRVEIFVGDGRFPCTVEVRHVSEHGVGMEAKEPLAFS